MGDRKVAFDALPHDCWPDIAAALVLPWPRAAAAHDLRWHAAEHHVGRRPLPDVRTLADRWGWSKSSVERLIQAPQKWADEARPWAWRKAQKCEAGTKVGHERDKVGTEVGQAETTNADNPTVAGHERDKVGTEVGQEWDSRARNKEHPAPDTQHPAPESDSLAQPPDHRAAWAALVAPPSGAEPHPAAELAPEATTAAPAQTLLLGGEVAPPVATAPGREPDDLRLYRVYQAGQPKRRATPSTDARKAMRRIIAEAGGLDRAELYLTWCYQSDDVRAQQLRGEAPWPDGTTTRRMDPDSLSRHVEARMDMAEAWDARGRTMTTGDDKGDFGRLRAEFNDLIRSAS